MSEARLRANRKNALKSTGPKTVEGKALSSKNALKHGLSAQFHVVLVGEDYREFEEFRLRWAQLLQPDGPVEEFFVDRAAQIAWRLKRSVKLERDVLSLCVAERTEVIGEDDSTEHVSIYRFLGVPVELRLVGEYERRLERSLFQTLDRLDEMKVAAAAAKAEEEEAAAELAISPERGIRAVS